MKDNGLVERLRDAAVTVASGLELQRVLQTVRRRGGSSDAASMMLEYTRTKEELERLLLVEDRERIDRDLHDSVIQRLFATGLELQALAARYVQREPDLALRLIDAADGWDDTITQIRATIFALQPPDIEEGAPVGDRATSPGMRRRRLHPHTCGSDDEAGAVWWCRHQLGKKLSAVERGERVVFEVERLRIAEEKCRDSS